MTKIPNFNFNQLIFEFPICQIREHKNIQSWYKLISLRWFMNILCFRNGLHSIGISFKDLDKLANGYSGWIKNMRYAIPSQLSSTYLLLDGRPGVARGIKSCRWTILVCIFPLFAHFSNAQKKFKIFFN